MTEPNWDGWFPDQDFVDKTREAVDENLDRVNRVLAFKTGVQDMDGPFGALFRQLAFAHGEYLLDELAGVVTAREENRWIGVIGEVLDAFEWLTEGQS